MRYIDEKRVKAIIKSFSKLHWADALQLERELSTIAIKIMDRDIKT